MKIPLADLKAQYSTIKDEIDEAIHRVLQQGQFILGQRSNPLKKRWLPTAAHSSLWVLPLGQMPASRPPCLRNQTR